jgi:MinD superfamily P-loop ATPase
LDSISQRAAVIGIASGKGGTGKTTLAVNLARSLAMPVRLLDCDVEEPNGHIFLKPQIDHSETVGVPVPVVDETRCTACGECGAFCQFNAIVALKTKPLVFPELCHGCGGCMMVCPEEAISETQREIGQVRIGRGGPITFVQGRLNVGEVMSPPLIRAVKEHVRRDMLTIIDAPPGTSCPMIEAIQDCHFVALVTEPTPFGLHDLTLAVETVRQLGIPCGVVINRADIGDARVVEYCRREAIPILLEIPDDRRIAEAYSRGRLALEAAPELGRRLQKLYSDIQRLILRDSDCVDPGARAGRTAKGFHRL